MMNSPLLSIIVPVYNVEQYLKKCIDSILSQTLTDFELILVDDGSTDNSGIICDEYAKFDNRIKVIHKVNGGISSARNKGIDISKGNFITFVDSDDWLATNYVYSSNIEIMQNNLDVDILQYPFYECINGEIMYQPLITPKLYSSKKEIFLNWSEGNIIKIYAWNKIYRRKVFDKIRFSEDTLFGEDYSIIPDFISNIKSLYISDIGYYCYKRNINSLSLSKYTVEKSVCSVRNKIKHYKTLLLFEDTDSVKLKYFFEILREYIYAKILSMNKLDLSNEYAFIKNHIPNILDIILYKENWKNRIILMIIKIIGLKSFIKLYVDFVLLRIKGEK